MDNPDVMPDSRVDPNPQRKPERVYNKRDILVPNEIEIEGQQEHNPFMKGRKHTIFRTTDKEMYIRNAFTGQIRSTSKEVKGKAARKAAKRLRRKLNGKKEESTRLNAKEPQGVEEGS